MCRERYLSKLLPDVLRKLATITLWPAAKSPVTLSIVQRRKVHNAQQKPPQPKAYRQQLEGVSIAVCSRLPSEGSRTKTYATNN